MGITRKAPRLLAALLLAGLCVLPACGSSSEACTSSDKTGPCQGTFTCSNGGLTFSCDKATQVCVIAPGSVTCQTVPGASSASCPSPAEAAAQAGCTTPFMPACSGSASAGIVVTCKQ